MGNLLRLFERAVAALEVIAANLQQLNAVLTVPAEDNNEQQEDNTARVALGFAAYQTA